MQVGPVHQFDHFPAELARIFRPPIHLPILSRLRCLPNSGVYRVVRSRPRGIATPTGHAGVMAMALGRT